MIRSGGVVFTGLVAAGLLAGRAGAEGPPEAAPAPTSPPPTAREAALEERLRALERNQEADHRRMAEMEAMLRRYEALAAGRAAEPAKPAPDPGVAATATPEAEAEAEAEATETQAPGTPPDTSDEGGAGARDNPPRDDSGGGTSATIVRPGPGANGRPSTRNTSGGGGGARDNRARARTITPAKVNFGPGFELTTDDDEFQLQFHYLSQIDTRIYEQARQEPVHSGFSFPRQRLYISGRMTKPIEYFLTLNRGFGSLDLLDSFLNFRAVDDRLMFKFGRFKTPFSYEFYAISAQDLIVPDRSLFSVNFSPNRQLGFMGWGQLFSKKLDYAVGIFNGNRFSFQDVNESKDVIAYLNYRPFQAKPGEEPGLLDQFNVGGSVDFGNQQNPLQPVTLRTSVAASNAGDAANIAPPFLTFNNNVVESGGRSLWNVFFAYYRKGLSLTGEFDIGYDTFAPGPISTRVRVPVQGYYVAAGYFLTGETVERRTQLRPLRPFSLKPGKFGPGAVEVVGRWSSLDLGDSVFTGGLADRNLWTDRVSTFDLGVNWYLNTYTKVFLGWEHAEFADPVLYRPDARQGTSDQFWGRCQIYF